MEILETLYRSESRRILATLIRLLGDFDLAEEAMHEAFRAALAQWPAEGVPENPRAWLISTGRFKAIDRLRRTRSETPLEEAPEPAETDTETEEQDKRQGIGDDRLRLILFVVIRL